MVEVIAVCTVLVSEVDHQAIADEDEDHKWLEAEFTKQHRKV